MVDKEVVLLNFWASPFGMRVRIALAEKGVEYTYRSEEDLWNKKSELLLKVNPVHNKVPVLIHNGRPVCESLVIVEYIEEVWTHNPLLPSNPYQRAHARFWAHFVDNKLYKCGRRIWTTKGDDQEAAKTEFTDCLKLLEQELGDKTYFGGDKFGFIDVAVVPFYCWICAFEVVYNFKIKESFPKIVEWAKRCSQRESVAKSLPNLDKFVEFLLEILNKSDLQ